MAEITAKERLSESSHSSLMSTTTAETETDNITQSSSISSIDSEASSQNIRVVARVRPLSSKEIIESSKVSIVAKQSLKEIDVDKNRRFEYDEVFGPDATQVSVYEKTAGDMIQNHLFRGFNVTILAYGQTGSGKTHTVFGANGNSVKSELDDCDGIIPRAVHDVFNFTNNTNKEGSRVQVELSFLEIYNEEAKDLLGDPDASDLVIRESANEGVVVQNLSRHKVVSCQEVAALMDSASEKRSTAATAMNSVSSRSHAICTLYVTKSPVESSSTETSEEEISAKLTLVDLAGSERVKKTGAEGSRLKEGININKGLFVLGQVVSALSELSQQSSTSSSSIHVKYRDSKLTRLLQDSLGGNSKTVMVACVSPADSNVEESVNTLRYAERTRSIKNTAVKNVVISTMTPAEAAALRRENQMLKLQLLQAEAKLKTSSSTTPLGMRVVKEPSIDASCVSTSTPSASISPDEINGLDIKKLDIVTKLRLNCSSLEEKISHLENKADEAIHDSLQASFRGDKWQVRCEELMTIMKNNGIAIPSELQNEGRLQSLNMVNELRKELIEIKNKLREAELDAEVSRATAGALLNGKENMSIAETMAFVSDSSQHVEKFANCKDGNEESAERLSAELNSMSGSIEEKEEMIKSMNKEKDCMSAMQSQFESAIQSLQEEVGILSAEREDLLSKLNDNGRTGVKTAKTGNNDTKRKEIMRQRITVLEEKMRDLKRRSADHSKVLRMRDQAERKCQQLETELKGDKKRKAELQRRLKEESVERRTEKKQAQLNAARLLRDSQRMKVELTKVKSAAAKQEAVLRRKASEALNKQKALAELSRKRSRNSGPKLGITIERKVELESWIERELYSATALKDLRAQIDSNSHLLHDAEAKKQVLNSQEKSGEKSSKLRSIDTEIELITGIIKQLEKNVCEVYKAANKGMNGSRENFPCFLETSLWQSLNRSEMRQLISFQFEKLVDEQCEHAEINLNHKSFLDGAVSKAVNDVKRSHRKEIFKLKVQHSRSIADLLESTKATIESSIGEKVQSSGFVDSSLDGNVKEQVDEMLGDYLSSCSKIAERVQNDLKSIKANQDGMKAAVDNVVVEMITQNSVQEPKTKKSKKRIQEDSSSVPDELFDFDDDLDDGAMEDDDSDWAPTPMRKKQKQEDEHEESSTHSSVIDVPKPDHTNDDLEKRTVLELRNLLRKRGLAVSGRKAELIARLTFDNNKGFGDITVHRSKEEMEQLGTKRPKSRQDEDFQSSKKLKRSNSPKVLPPRSASKPSRHMAKRPTSPILTSASSPSYSLSTFRSTGSRRSHRNSPATKQTSPLVTKISPRMMTMDSPNSSASTKSTISTSSKSTKSKGKTSSSISTPVRLRRSRRVSVSGFRPSPSLSAKRITRTKVAASQRKTPKNATSKVQTVSKRISSRLTNEVTTSLRKPQSRIVSSRSNHSTIKVRGNALSIQKAATEQNENTRVRRKAKEKKVTTFKNTSEKGAKEEKENTSKPSFRSLSGITHSAKKRRSRRRESMAKSVNNALMQLENIQF